MLRQSLLCACACVMLLMARPEHSFGGVIEYWNDPSGWLSAAPDYKFNDFTAFTHGTIMTDQIPGLTFTTFVFIHHAGYNDNFGLLGNNGIRIEFDTPQYAVGIDHLGDVAIALYYQGDLVALAPACPNCPFPGAFVYPGPGVAFSGITSDLPFDEVYFFKPMPPYSNNAIGIDNLYWAPIPAPGIGPFLLLAGLCALRKRRR